MLKLELIDNWKQVMTQAWSVKLGFASAVFGLLNALMQLGLVLPYLQDYLPAGTFLILAILCAAAGFFSRFLKQHGFNDPAEAKDGSA